MLGKNMMSETLLYYQLVCEKHLTLLRVKESSLVTQKLKYNGANI